MENIGLFLATTVIYFFVWFLFTFNGPRRLWTQHAKRMALVAFLALPLNINGNVFTIAGNATAEKSVYSLFSVYQKAGQNAVTLVGLGGYQKAGQDAVTLFGLAGYQKAGQNAATASGLAGYQNAGQDTMTVFGLAGYQNAKENAKVPVAIALYQRVGEKTRAFGAFSSLTKD